MQIVDLDKFIPFVYPEISNCPELFIKDKVLQAIIDFCTNSWAWLFWTDVQVFESDESEIYVDVPAQSVPVGILKALKSNNDYSLDLVSLEYDKVTIKKDLSEKTDFQFQLALKPSRFAEVVPLWLLEDYPETIAYGTKAKLFSMAGQSWSNMELASIQSQNFRAGVDSAIKDKRMKENTQRDIRVKSKKFV